MNVYEKLNLAREKFHTSTLKKSGLNKFAGYSYFELSDFVVPALKIFKEVGLTGFVSFGKEIAELKIIDTENPDQSISITSPMSTAALKGCHEVQNLGAVQTYIRRYLWVAALEIVEHDALDMTTGQGVHKPTRGALVSDKQVSQMHDVADAINEHFARDDIIGAYEEAIQVTDSEEKTYLWSLLDSKVRSALKKHGESIKGN